MCLRVETAQAKMALDGIDVGWERERVRKDAASVYLPAGTASRGVGAG